MNPYQKRLNISSQMRKLPYLLFIFVKFSSTETKNKTQYTLANAKKPYNMAWCPEKKR